MTEQPIDPPEDWCCQDSPGAGLGDDDPGPLDDDQEGAPNAAKS